MSPKGAREHAASDAAPLDRRGLELLAEVAGYVAAGLGSEETLRRIAHVVTRRLDGGSCRIWTRTPDGSAFQPVLPEGAKAPGPQLADEVAQWVYEPPLDELVGEHWQLRMPLVYDGEALGLLECVIPDGPAADTLRRAVDIVTNFLAPQLAAIELSEDLASEVALRTREIESQRRLTTKIIDSLPVGLYVIDREYRIQVWNRKRETGTQGVVRQEVLGRPVFDVLSRQPRSLIKREFDRVFETGQMEQVEVVSETSGDVRHYRISKIPMRVHDDEVTHVITIGEDVTEWREVQLQIAQTEKLAAVGQLAAGVMHEINNPLATIGACVEALELRSADLDDIERQGIDEYLRIIDSELARCKSIVEGLLDFSRPKARMKRPAEVNQVVEDALFLVKHHEKFKRIELIREFGDSLPPVECNVEQLIQVFLALMLNAIDAMDGHGVLAVRTRINRERDDEVVVEFADTGHGISREVLSKIFEPFYTTKQPGRGTGLGLSICYGIVQEHRGRIAVDSAVGRGSVFRVFLPFGQSSEERR